MKQAALSISRAGKKNRIFHGSMGSGVIVVAACTASDTLCPYWRPAWGRPRQSKEFRWWHHVHGMHEHLGDKQGQEGLWRFLNLSSIPSLRNSLKSLHSFTIPWVFKLMTLGIFKHFFISPCNWKTIKYCYLLKISLK